MFLETLVRRCFQIEFCSILGARLSSELLDLSNVIEEGELNPKRAGLFCLFKSGGADSAPPPRISAAERRKILKFGTDVE